MSLLALCSCAQKEQSSDSHIYGALSYQGFEFTTTKAPAFENAVESSLVMYQGSLNYFVDNGIDRTVWVGHRYSDLVKIESDMNRSYVFEHNGTYYHFFNTGVNIYASRSTDLIKWTMMNNNQPVMTTQAGTIYGTIWNPSVAIDQNGLWHMLVECETNGDNAIAGLGYATATLNGDNLNFDLNRTSNYVITNAGNAWMTFVPNKGLLIVYGKSLGFYWYVTAATMENGVFQENANFKISAPNIHIADPHLIETPEGVTMSLSYDQYSIYEMKSNQTMTQLYEQVRN